MFDPKIKVSKATYEKIKVAAQIMGVSSVEEFVEQVLLAKAEEVIAQTGSSSLSQQEIEQIANQMKGLGYIE